MSDIAKDLTSDYERDAQPEGADAYRHDDVRIRAADEIRSMRRVIARLRLTDAEREAVAWAVDAASNDEHPAEDILRGLLERTGGKT